MTMHMSVPCRISVDANGNYRILPPAGQITQIGDAGVTSCALAANDDLFVSGKLEVDGLAYFESTVELRSLVYNKSVFRIMTSSIPYGYSALQAVQEVVTVAKGSSSQVSATINLPAGSVLLDAVCRVNQSVDGTGPPTNFNVFWTTQDAANHDQIFDNLSVALATTGATHRASGAGGGDNTHDGSYALRAANTLTVETTNGADVPTIVPADSATTFQVRILVVYTAPTVPTG